MNIIKKIASGTLALVLATGIAGSSLAKDDHIGDVSVSIHPIKDGGYSASIGDLRFGSYQYRLTDRVVPGTVTIGASDLRGDAQGWSVTITGGDFDGDFGIHNLSLDTGTVTKTSKSGHPTEAVPSQNAITKMSNDEQTVLVAAPGTGAGEYNATYNASLNIPAGTLVGGYQTTLTVSISGDQPGGSVATDD